MSEYQFLCGWGKLKNRRAVERIARKHGAQYILYTEPQCSCGYGCPSGECENSTRHWFAAENMGTTFDDSRAFAVETDLRAAGIIE